MRYWPFFIVLVCGLLIPLTLSSAQPEDKKDVVKKVETKDQQERPSHPFDQQWLKNRAKTLAQLDFVEQVIAEDNPLSKLSYDDYRRIQFQRAATIWSKEDRQFRLSPMHPGFLFKTPVKLNLVVGGVSRRILYTTEIFDYDDQQAEVKNVQATGYSGFRVTNPINRSDKWDEFLVFQGGTYFRALGESNWYGLSSRGLAVNTAKPSGEEFPMFTEFWIERPKTDAQSIVVHALMESRSVTGAFTFTATPGKSTQIKVSSTLYPRKDIQSFGIGPLTSMFLFNPMDNTRFDDSRAAVHDSDGLFMITKSGEKIWRPLTNPRKLEVSVFKDTDIQGFGLMQRRREFHQFDDIEAHYQDRPSAWVEPIDDWGPGHVELIEIPTNAEIHDNIVAFWQPEKAMKAGEEYTFNYNIWWSAKVSAEDSAGRIVSTTSGIALENNNVRDFIIDYAGTSIPENLEISASGSTGNIVGTVQKMVPQTGHLRVIVKFEPEKDAASSELRVALKNGEKQWGETWLYRWTQ